MVAAVLNFARPRYRRAPVHTVYQMEAVECGAACLAMVLGHHGRWAPLEEVRDRVGVSRNGSNARGILDAARGYGLRAAAYSKEPAELHKLPLPAILFWEFDHFVVLEGIRGNRYVINDPAQGRRILSAAEFGDGFTGVALAFERKPQFEFGGRAPSVLRSLGGRLGGSRGAIVYLVVINLLLVVPGLIVPAFARIFVDDYLQSHFHTWLVPLLIAMAVTAFVRIGLLALQGHFLLKLETKLALAESAAILWRLLNLPQRFFSRRDAAELGSRVRVANQIAGAVTGPLATSILSLVSIVAYAICLFLFDVVIALITFGFVAANFLALRWATQRLASRDRLWRLQQGRSYGVALQGLARLDSYRAAGNERNLFDRWTTSVTDAANSEMKSARLREWVKTLPVATGGLLAIAVVTIGALRVIDGEMTLGTLVAAQFLAAMVNAPIAQLVEQGAELQSTAGALLRSDDLEGYASEDVHDSDAAALPMFAGTAAVELRGVSFGYTPGEPVLHEIDLQIPARAQVAILGASGSGKTTLGKLIAGLEQPWDGSIRYDGVDAAAMPLDAVRRSVGYVEQAPTLFAESLRTNLSLWDPTIGESEMVAACKAAEVHDVIVSRPAGYNHQVSEGQSGFSGGEVQRLAIARALAARPPILLLDEGTSALDTVTEEQVLSNLKATGCTRVLLSHRASAIRDSDLIIVLKSGRIVQSGTHTQLVRDGGLYRSLVEAA